MRGAHPLPSSLPLPLPSPSSLSRSPRRMTTTPARPATTIAMVRYGRGSLRTNRSISTQKTGDVCADARHEVDGEV